MICSSLLSFCLFLFLCLFQIVCKLSFREITSSMLSSPKELKFCFVETVSNIVEKKVFLFYCRMYLHSTINNSQKVLVTEVETNRNGEKRRNENLRRAIVTGKLKNSREISQILLLLSTYWKASTKQNPIIISRIFQYTKTSQTFVNPKCSKEY